MNAIDEYCSPRADYWLNKGVTKQQAARAMIVAINHMDDYECDDGYSPMKVRAFRDEFKKDKPIDGVNWQVLGETLLQYMLDSVKLELKQESE